VWIYPPLFTPDSAALVVASDESSLELVRASDGAHLTTIVPPGRDWFLSVALSADGSTLAVSSVTDPNSSTSTITTWHLPDGALLGTVVFPADLGGGIPVALALSPHGEMVAASIVPGGADSLLVWSGDQLLYRHDGETDFAVAFSPDGATLATASAASRGVRLLRASDGALVAARTLPVDSR
jgi:WD40 repeat protein